MSTLIIWLLIISIRDVASEFLNEDRFVIRENTPKTLSCENKMENVKRIRWDFTSSQTNTTETIYDHRSKEILKAGFEVSCFQSYCNLKLLKARKENSGKYVCLVDKMENYFVRMKPIIEIELVIRGPVRKTMVAEIGDSIILPCEHNIRNVTRTRWSQINLQGVHNYYLYYMGSKEKLDNNYEALCGFHELACYLKILRVSKESAGKYICMHGETLEYEDKYGYDEMTYFVEIDLVVGKLECNENSNGNLTLIGENDCYGLEPEILNLKCSFSYYGSTDHNDVHLKWVEKHESFDEKSISLKINHKVKSEINIISIETNLSVNYEMSMKYYQCIIEGSMIKPCQKRPIIQFVKNVTKRSEPQYINRIQNVKCSANKSQHVFCLYHWTHEFGGAKAETWNELLLTENIKTLGVYTCIATCELKGHKKCIAKAMEFEVIANNLTIISIAILSILLTAILIAAIVFYVKYKKLQNEKRRKRSYFQEKKVIQDDDREEGRYIAEPPPVRNDSQDEIYGKGPPLPPRPWKTSDDECQHNFCPEEPRPQETSDDEYNFYPEESRPQETSDDEYNFCPEESRPQETSDDEYEICVERPPLPPRPRAKSIDRTDYVSRPKKKKKKPLRKFFEFLTRDP